MRAAGGGGGGGGGGGSSGKYCKKRRGHLLITWPGGGGGAYRNFDLSNISPPPPSLYINNDRSLTAYLHQLYFSFFSPPAVVTCAYKAAIF